MKKTLTPILFLSLSLIISSTIYTVERKSAKAIVSNYLNNGGKMILHTKDQKNKLNLLEHFQGLSKLYQGKMTKDIKIFSNTSTWNWLRMSSLDYTQLVKKFCMHKYKIFNNNIESNIFTVPQELLSTLKGYLDFDYIKELYKLQVDKNIQKNYPLGYLPIWLLNGFALFSCYQADLTKFNTVQHLVLLAMGVGEFVYVTVAPAFIFLDFFETTKLGFCLDHFNFFFMLNCRRQRMSLFAFAPSIITMIKQAIRFYQNRQRYDTCEQKINNMKIQGFTHNEFIEDLHEAITLLEDHKKVTMLCSKGDFFNEDYGFTPETVLNSDIGSIVAQHIDPSINLSNTSIDQSESGYSCLKNRCCQAITITAATSAFLIPFASFVLQQYFSS